MNSAGKFGLWLWVYRGHLFSSLCLTVPFFGIGLFLVYHYVCRYRHLGFQIYFAECLIRQHTFFSSESRLLCAWHCLQKQNCKVTSFDTCHALEADGAGFQAFIWSYSLRVSVFSGERWFLKLFLDLFRVSCAPCCHKPKLVSVFYFFSYPGFVGCLIIW